MFGEEKVSTLMINYKLPTLGLLQRSNMTLKGMGITCQFLFKLLTFKEKFTHIKCSCTFSEELVFKSAYCKAVRKKITP